VSFVRAYFWDTCSWSPLRPVVNTALNLWAQWKIVNFFTSWATVSWLEMCGLWCTHMFRICSVRHSCLKCSVLYARGGLLCIRWWTFGFWRHRVSALSSILLIRLFWRYHGNVTFQYITFGRIVRMMTNRWHHGQWLQQSSPGIMGNILEDDRSLTSRLWPSVTLVLPNLGN
jgi:hypothetical protein